MLKILYIQDNITINNGIKNDEYLAYLGLLMLLRRKRNVYYGNVRYLAYELGGKIISDDRILSTISSGISGLADKKIISITSTDISDEWIIDVKDIVKNKSDEKSKEIDGKENIKNEDRQKTFYTVVDKNEIATILSYEEIKQYSAAISLLRFYIYLLSTIHKKKDDSLYGVGFTSISDMVTAMKHNKKTISKYIKQLEELKLIYVYRAKNFIKFDDGTFVEISHTYGRFRDKDKIIELGEKHEKEYGFKFKSEFKKIKKSTGDTRSNSQKYNAIFNALRDGKEIKYGYKELEEIFLSMCELNKRYENECRNDRIKDLSIFSGYDFYYEQY